MKQPMSLEDLGIPDYLGTYLDFLDFRIVDAKPGFVRMEMPLNRQHTNTMGMAHGGIIMSMLDIAGAFSAHMHSDHDQVSITVSQNTNFIRPVTGEVLVAEGRIVRRTGSTAFTESHILDPSAGDNRETQLCAQGQCVFRLRDRDRAKVR